MDEVAIYRVLALEALIIYALMYYVAAGPMGLNVALIALGIAGWLSRKEKQ